MREHCWHPHRTTSPMLICCHCGASGKRVPAPDFTIPDGHGKYYPVGTVIAITPSPTGEPLCEEGG